MQVNENINNTINITKQNIFNEIINSLSSGINQQKKFIKYIHNLIILISLNNKEYILQFENINQILPNIISELSISFTDLFINNNDLINYYLNIFLKNKTPIIKNIFANIINVFNFKSVYDPITNLSEILKNYDEDIKQLINNKRNEKTEIEEIYELLNLTYNNIINAKEGDENLESYIEELTNKVNEINNKNICTNATKEFLNEKITEIKDLFNGKKVNNNININNINSLNINKFNKLNKLNNNFHPFNYPFFFPMFNNMNNDNNVNNNNIVITEELNKVKEIPLKERTFFYKDEELREGENEYIEFKHYNYPFSQEKIDELTRQDCGFLNNHGGRIYIGIDDLRKVKGIRLDYKTCDTIRNELINYTYDFYPKCRLNKINVYFIPVRAIQNKKNINNLYVIQIIILPGEPYNLYSITNKGGFISTLRLPGQCINLTAEEIHSEIMRRGELLKEKYLNEINDNNNNNDENENQDEEETIEKSEESDISTENNMSIIYVVKLNNIDTSLKVKAINRFFNEGENGKGIGCCYQKFPAKEGKSIGYGEIHFPTKERAKSFIQKYKGISLCGKKQIIMILKKRRTINKDEKESTDNKYNSN